MKLEKIPRAAKAPASPQADTTQKLLQATCYDYYQVYYDNLGIKWGVTSSTVIARRGAARPATITAAPGAAVAAAARTTMPLMCFRLSRC
jgi:hypothetical protein